LVKEGSAGGRKGGVQSPKSRVQSRAISVQDLGSEVLKTGSRILDLGSRTLRYAHAPLLPYADASPRLLSLWTLDFSLWTAFTYGLAFLRAAAASSGVTVLMENPVPHSNPAVVVIRGVTSRYQWYGLSGRKGAV